MIDTEFTEEQKQYLQGFATGSGMVRSVALPVIPAAAPIVETDPNRAAQQRVLDAGKKLTAEEQAKRKIGHGLDIWDHVVQHARDAKYPKGTDVFLFKFQGMFYVAPAQDAFMCRLRLPGGMMTSAQMRGVARLADDFAGGYADITTRANLQLRQITAKHTVDVLMGLHELGIINRGAGADNIRNITCSPTAGIDPQELIDTRPLARQMHHYILNHREMYGLPRKFNIAFDGGGRISALEDTNDIGLTAVREKTVPGEKAVPGPVSLPPEVSTDIGPTAEKTTGTGTVFFSDKTSYSPGATEIEKGTGTVFLPPEKTGTGTVFFRLTLGGITGHRDFARDTGIALTPEECIPVAAAIVRAFIEHGDRTDRKKARLKYVLDRMGLDRFIEEVEKHHGAKLRRVSLDESEPRPPVDKHGHIGVHGQKQPGLSYIGIVLPVGRMNADQMRAIADIADRHGSGTIRLTVWQNLLISDIPNDRIEQVKQELAAANIGFSATSIRGGLVACTGSAGCKYASADTKTHALQISDYLESRLQLDQPVNIHLTGCHHSCAQHYIGDIGLLATKIGDEAVEGYHIHVGGGYGAEQGIAREVVRNVPAADAPAVIERMLRAYLAQRTSPEESFVDFARRLSIEDLTRAFNAEGAHP